MGKVKPQPKSFASETKKNFDKNKIGKQYNKNDKNKKNVKQALKQVDKPNKTANLLIKNEPLVKVQEKVKQVKQQDVQKKTTQQAEKTKSFEKTSNAKVLTTKTPSTSNILVTEEQAAKGVNAVLQLLKKSSLSGSKNMDIFSDEKEIFVQVSLIKVPKIPNRMVHFALAYPVIGDEPEICLIVPDAKGIDRLDHEKTIDYYEEFLREKGVKGVTKILPIDQLFKEYDQFELKNKLANLYDIFLVDGKISGKVFNRLGKVFFKKRKMPHCVNLGCADLKKNFNLAIRKVGMHLHSNGDNFSVQVGNTKMPEKQIVKNVISVVQLFKTQFPGGWANIRGLYVKSPNTTSIPIYFTFKSKTDVQIPVIESKKPKAFTYTEGEITTKPGLEVMVLPTGKIINKRPLQGENKEAKKNKKQKVVVEKQTLDTTATSEDFNEEEEKDFKQLKKELGIDDEEVEDLQDEFSEDEEEEVKNAKVKSENPKNKKATNAIKVVEKEEEEEDSDDDDEEEDDDAESMDDDEEEDIDEADMEELTKYVKQQLDNFKKTGQISDDEEDDDQEEDDDDDDDEEEEIVQKPKSKKDQKKQQKQVDNKKQQKQQVNNKKQDNAKVVKNNNSNKKDKAAVKNEIPKMNLRNKNKEGKENVVLNGKSAAGGKKNRTEAAPNKNNRIDKKSNNTSFLEETIVKSSPKNKPKSKQNKAAAKTATKVETVGKQNTKKVNTDALFEKLSEKKLKKKSKK